MGQIRSLLENLTAVTEAYDDDHEGENKDSASYKQGIDDGYTAGFMGRKRAEPSEDKDQDKDYAVGWKRGVSFGNNVRNVIRLPDTARAHRSSLHILKNFYKDLVKSNVGKRLGVEPDDVAGELASNDMPSRVNAFVKQLAKGKWAPRDFGRFIKVSSKFTAGHIAQRGRGEGDSVAKPGSIAKPLAEPRAVGSFADLPGGARVKSHHRTKSPYGKDASYAAPLGQIKPGVPVTGGKTTFDVPESDKPAIKAKVKELIASHPASPQKFHPKADPQRLLELVFVKRMNRNEALNKMGIKNGADGIDDKKWNSLEQWANRLVKSFADRAREDPVLRSFVHNPEQFDRSRADDDKRRQAGRAGQAARLRDKKASQGESVLHLRPTIVEELERESALLEWIDWLQAAAA